MNNFHQKWKKVSKGAKIRNRYNHVPHLTQDTDGKVTNSQLDTTNESQEFSPFLAGDHKAHINRWAQRHSKHKTEQIHRRSTKEVRVTSCKTSFKYTWPWPLTFDSKVISVIWKPSLSSRHHKQSVCKIRTPSDKTQEGSWKGSYIPNRRTTECLDL